MTTAEDLEGRCDDCGRSVLDISSNWYTDHDHPRMPLRLWCVDCAERVTPAN